MKTTWPSKIERVTTKGYCRFLYRVYVDACSCSVDYDNRCDCGAGDECRAELERLLGPHWHDICREAFPTTD